MFLRGAQVRHPFRDADLGGLAALLLTFPFTGAGLGAEQAERYRTAFPVVAAFFLVFALPVLLILKERARPAPAPAGGYAREGLRRLRRPQLLRRVPGGRELRAALDYLASGAHFGKICLRIPK